MLHWLVGALLGFAGEFLSEFLRGLYDDYVARSALRENGRLEQENKQLKEQIRVKDKAKQIREKIDAEENLGSLIDRL